MGCHRADAKREEIRLKEQALEKEGKKRKGKKPKDPGDKPDSKAQRNFTDPESRIMKDGASKSFEQAYNCQAAVDAKSQIIVATNVIQQANDKQQLEPLVEEIKKNTGEKTPEKLSADSGYFSEANVEYLEDEGIDGFIATGRQTHGEVPEPAGRGRIAKDATTQERMARKLRTKKGREIYSKRSRDFYRVNCDGTKNLVEVCLPENIDRFIFLSSIASVGPNREHGILLNEQSPCRPIDPYGRSKLGAEKLLMNFFKKHGFPIVIVRPPTVYGPSGRSQIIKKILYRVQKGRHLILGSKKKLRSMCYINNLIQGLTRVERSTNSIGEIYFFADERPYTYNEIFQTVAQEMGIVLKEIHLPGWIGSICGLAFKSLSTMGFYSLPLYMAWHMVLDMACDISKAKEELHYKPKIDMKEGIQKTIRYYLNKNSI